MRNHKGNQGYPIPQATHKMSFAFQNIHYKRIYLELIYGKQHKQDILCVSIL